MNVGETLKNVGITLGGLLIMVALFGLAMVFIVGATAVSVWIMEWVPVVFWSALLIALFILGPLSLIPPARFVVAIGLVIASFVFGAMMWCSGVAFTYDVWGTMGVIIGLHSRAWESRQLPCSQNSFAVSGKSCWDLWF
jgi:hypothetical protein